MCTERFAGEQSYFYNSDPKHSIILSFLDDILPERHN